MKIAAVREACGADIQKHCPGVKPGAGRILLCVKQHFAAMSEPCKDAIGHAASSRSRSWRPGIHSRLAVLGRLVIFRRLRYGRRFRFGLWSMVRELFNRLGESAIVEELHQGDCITTDTASPTVPKLLLDVDKKFTEHSPMGERGTAGVSSS